MKKTFRQDDGSFVTIEGTPPEIREYERILEREREERSRKQPVLKGSEQDGVDEALKRLLEELTAGQPKPITSDKVAPWWPSYPQYPQYPGRCMSCGGSPCICHITYPLWPLYPQIWCKTVTTSGNSIVLPELSVLQKELNAYGAGPH